MTQTNEWDKAYLEETKVLLNMTEEQRRQYVCKAILNLAEATRKILKAKNLTEILGKINKFSKEISQQDKGKIYLTCLLYSIKPEYRPCYIELLKAMSGIKQKVILPQPKSNNP